MSTVGDVFKRLDEMQAAAADGTLPPVRVETGSTRRHYLFGALVGAGVTVTLAAAWLWWQQAGTSAPAVVPHQPAAEPVPAAAPGAATPSVPLAPAPAEPPAAASPPAPAAAIAGKAEAVASAAAPAKPPRTKPAVAEPPSAATAPAPEFPRSQLLKELLRQSVDAPLTGGLDAAGWIADGWNVFRQGSMVGALTRWESAFKARGGAMTVLVAAVYLRRAALQEALQKLDPAPGTFALRAPYGDRELTYLLVVAADPATTAETEDKLKAVTGAAALPRLPAAALLARMSQPADAEKAKTAEATAVPKPAKRPEPVPVSATKQAPPPKLRDAEPPPLPERPAMRAETSAESIESLDERISLALQAKDFKEAAQLTEQLTTRTPARAHAWLRRGTALLGLGQLDEADQSFEKALAIDANIMQAWLQRALVAQERQDHPAALRMLERAAKLSPDSPDVHFNMAISYQASGDRAQARQAYRTFLALTEGRSNYAKLRWYAQQRLDE